MFETVLSFGHGFDKIIRMITIWAMPACVIPVSCSNIVCVNFAAIRAYYANKIFVCNKRINFSKTGMPHLLVFFIHRLPACAVIHPNRLCATLASLSFITITLHISKLEKPLPVPFFNPSCKLLRCKLNHVFSSLSVGVNLSI